ncbi:uncharacterized protein BJ171DRAFT_595344 [Polychytrium aggregatum]|uniref:uncharacterized protein n=1 Tax=Polychytrium aggregatum TaxID=110093 RepID=UPI0022FF0789|nr:uncharacterized protein BJ171DRAFT_595344 [Polychytrium aggregatum]KAI9208900.1 hypothetical protein BJ171DRAFT_595344 [Polychytrium aggregatum]
MPLNISKLTQDILGLAVLGLFLLGWLLFFIGTCVQQIVLGPGNGIFWFQVLYHLGLALGLTFLNITDGIKSHRLALMALLTIGTVLIINSLTVLLYVERGATAAAGSFFMSFVYFFWIIRFGSEEDSPVNKIELPIPARGNNLTAEAPQAPANAARTGFKPQIQIPKFSLPVFGKKGNAQAEQTTRDIQPQGYAPQPHVPAQQPQQPQPYQAAQPIQVVTTSEPHAPSAAQTSAPVPGAAEPAQKAVAMYPYTANASDPTELSFEKNEILEIINTNGKWWRARRVDAVGKVIEGIIPSNYVRLL